MENKLKQFLDDAFKPYGNFPARKDVELIGRGLNEARADYEVRFAKENK